MKDFEDATRSPLDVEIASALFQIPEPGAFYLFKNFLKVTSRWLRTGEYVALNLTLASARLDSSDGEVRHPRRMD